jgi:hypothetical protein
MIIAGVGKTLVHLLRNEFQARHGGLEGLTFELFTTTSFESTPSNKVSLFLYRIDVDPTRRHKQIPPSTFGVPARSVLCLDLRYLVTVWVSDAEREHQILQDCIEILESHAIISGPLLDTGYPWEPGDALTLAIDALSHEDMMRLWDLLEPTYRLSVPYVVRSVKLTSVEQPAAPPVLVRTNVIIPRVQQP